jgi:hypothetical protein
VPASRGQTGSLPRNRRLDEKLTTVTKTIKSHSLARLISRIPCIASTLVFTSFSIQANHMVRTFRWINAQTYVASQQMFPVSSPTRLFWHGPGVCEAWSWHGAESSASQRHDEFGERGSFPLPLSGNVFTSNDNSEASLPTPELSEGEDDSVEPGFDDLDEPWPYEFYVWNTHRNLIFHH